MASLLTHPVIPLTIAALLGREIIPKPLVLLGLVYSALPDLDGVTFKLGIPYGSEFGHRGFTHSIAVACICALLGAPAAGHWGARKAPAVCFLFAAMISHGILDSMTAGGLGVEFFWPLNHSRFFLPWRPIEVSPVSPRLFFTARGSKVVSSELAWVWSPALVSYLLIGGLRWAYRLKWRKRRRENRPDSTIAPRPDSTPGIEQTTEDRANE